MAVNSKNTPTPRGDGNAAHAAEVEKGAKSREVLNATADESPLAFNGTTEEKALQTTAALSDMDDKDEGAQVSAAASVDKIETAKKLDKESDSDSKDESSK